MQLAADAGKLVIFVAVMTAVILAFGVLGRLSKKLPERRRFSPLFLVDPLRTREFYVFVLLALFVLVLVHLVVPML